MTSRATTQHMYRVSFLIRSGVGHADVTRDPIRTSTDVEQLRVLLANHYSDPSLQVTGWSRYEN